MEESALRPIQMRIDIYGSGNYNGREHPFPNEYIKDALSQNILYHCYKEPRGIEELTKLCGVPAYYIEDCIENLTARDAVTEPVRKKRITNAPILRSPKNTTETHGNISDIWRQKTVSGAVSAF